MNRRDAKAFLRDTVAAAAALGLKDAGSDSVGDVAKALGVSRATLYHWINRANPRAIPVGFALHLAEMANIDIRDFSR